MPPPETRKKLHLHPPLKMSEASHSNDSRNSIIFVLENMVKTSMGIIPIYLQYAKVGMREAGQTLSEAFSNFYQET
jgi:hypothetical protein